MTAKPEPVLAAGAALGESPIWDDRTNTLLWVDIHRRQVHRFDPASGRNRTVTLDQPVGSVALRQGPGLIAAVGLSLGALDEEAGEFAPWHTVPEGERFNDGACDPAGRYLAGTLTDSPGGAALYSLEPSKALRRLLADVTLSNGLAWSPDEQTLYYIDTVLERIDAFDYETNTGSLGARRTVVDLRNSPGRPDGLTTDTDGNLWVAMAKGAAIRCYDPSGLLLDLITLPVPVVTSCTFGGPDLSDLYITTGQWPATQDQLASYPDAGAVFRLRGTGSKGRPVYRFAG